MASLWYVCNKRKREYIYGVHEPYMNFNLIVGAFGDTGENVGLNATSVAPVVVAPRPRARGPGARARV